MAKRHFRKRAVAETAPPLATTAPGPALGTLISTWPKWLPQAALIVALTVWIYWPALRGEFIWDDEWYITLNPLLNNATGLWKFWFQPGSWVEYYPLHETVLWCQYQLFGSNTLGYHLTNLALHLVSAFLVWHLFRKLGLRFAWLGGLLFAIHPVQVDSVAYICELKNTLSLPFALLAMSLWIDYDATRSRQDYGNALGFYVLAMLCKITLAPFAAVILVYAWWKRGRIDLRDLKACAPVLLIALVLAAFTVWTASAYRRDDHEIGAVVLGGLLSRLDAVGIISTLYFARCFLPVDVLLVYPQWPLQPLNPVHYLPWLVLAGVLAVLWRKRAGWGRHVLLGLGFFFILLAPFLGFLFVSYMDFTWALDHMLYLPIIGPIGLVIAGVEGIGAQIPAWARGLGVGIIAVVIASMAWVSHGFAALFAGGQVYWSHILERNPNVWIAHTNLGAKWVDLNRYQDALAENNAAIALRPDDAAGYYNRGCTLEKLGRNPEAQIDYAKALHLDPGYAKAYLNLGVMLLHAGDDAKAEAYFRAGLKSAPDNASLLVNLAGLLLQQKHLPEAIETYRRAVDLSPDSAQAQYDLGNVLLQTGDLRGAIDHLGTAVELDPKIVPARENLGSAFAQSGRLPEAIEQFQAAIQLAPGNVTTHGNLGLALAQSGQISEAIAEFKQVLALDPANARAKESLAKLQQFQLQNASGNR